MTTTATDKATNDIIPNEISIPLRTLSWIELSIGTCFRIETYNDNTAFRVLVWFTPPNSHNNTKFYNRLVMRIDQWGFWGRGIEGPCAIGKNDTEKEREKKKKNERYQYRKYEIFQIKSLKKYFAFGLQSLNLPLALIRELLERIHTFFCSFVEIVELVRFPLMLLCSLELAALVYDEIWHD